MAQGRSEPPGSAATAGPTRVESLALERRLRGSIAGEVSSTLGTRALYGSDASNYRILPILVVSPRTVGDLATTLALCHEAGAPITMRGAGTSVAGNACGPGVIVDTSRHLTRFLAMDPAAGTVSVEPGIILDDLNRRAAAVGLRFGPDPSTHGRCTVGGMIGNNACGPRSVRWGTTADNVIGLQVALVDGTVLDIQPGWPAATTGSVAPPIEARIEADLRSLVADHTALLRAELPPWARRVSGYALDWLLPERGFGVAKALVGTEGTCAVVTAATLKLVPVPPARELLVLGFPDEVSAAEAVPALLEERPATVEGVTAELLGVADQAVRAELLPAGRAWLLVEATGDSDHDARMHALRLAGTIGRRPDAADVRVLESAAAQAAIWRVRQEGAGRATRLPDGSAAWPGLEDVVVPPIRLPGYLVAFRKLLAEHRLDGTVYGHFGEGCIHVRIGFALDRPGGPEHLRSFMGEATDLVVAHGGSLSGEHGDGRARSELLARMFSPPMLKAFSRFKSIWDPAGTLNPGVVVRPAPIDQGLWPAAPTRIKLDTEFAYAADRGDFRTALQRCVGIGKCITRGSSALMCPSFRATGNERDSTRGRSRLLQAMINGDLAESGWRSKDVREALDLCLACKGCVSDCPTGVDMASYKSEFLAHFYRRRIRPPSHYSLGWLPLWLRLTRRTPRLVNLALANPLSGRLFSRLGGIAPEQPIPRLPGRTFVRGFQRSLSPGIRRRGRVVLWPDTFNNYLTPEVAHAGVRVLEAAGFEVEVPRDAVCCGLTWVSTGQLGRARQVLRQTLGAEGLGGEEPVVVLEPSCATSLRSDLLELLPDDPRARALARRVTTLAELLDGIGFETVSGSPVAALVQPHCHQQAVLGLSCDRRVMERNGITVAEMLVGCCGLAGNFGAQRGHEQVSRAVAALDLLPALERMPPDALVIADGFSCRTQIRSLAGRRALHLAEVLASRIDGH
jgi:FAD/FMN-containing dehydrogenase/Fe-S oxidoreductase